MRSFALPLALVLAVVAAVLAVVAGAPSESRAMMQGCRNFYTACVGVPRGAGEREN